MCSFYMRVTRRDHISSTTRHVTLECAHVPSWRVHDLCRIALSMVRATLNNSGVAGKVKCQVGKQRGTTCKGAIALSAQQSIREFSSGV